MAREQDPFKLSSPRIFLVRMLVFLVLCALLGIILYKQILAAFLSNPGLNGLIFGVLFVGIAVGMLLSLITYSFVRRRRDYASVVQVSADHYEVTVASRSIHRAREVLGRSTVVDQSTVAAVAARSVRRKPATEPQRPAQAEPSGYGETEPPRYGERVAPTADPAAPQTAETTPERAVAHGAAGDEEAATGDAARAAGEGAAPDPASGDAVEGAPRRDR